MKIQIGTKVCITGAASGIGRATALALARMGARLFLADINQEGLDETSRMIRVECGDVGLCKAADISHFEEVKLFADEIHRDFGPMDVLINNAGIALFALVEDMDHAHWQKVINTNLWGPIHGIECFLKEMIRAKKGHLVNISSTAGLTGAPWHAAYATAKWGLVGLSEVLRYDLMQHNINVSVICPGAVNTPMKHSAEILAVDRESGPVQKIIRRFEKHAISPERAAEIIIDAIEKNRFLVITSFDIKALYLLKRYCFPVYQFVLKYISRLLNSMKIKT
ncbi:MAG: SDR family oxidoreductase [Desulfobacterales bacterium]|nr:SDR family oxidoreductase [Desulfobacterales bacterium]